MRGAIAQDINRQRPIIALQRLARRAIAAVALLVCGLGVMLITQMFGASGECPMFCV
jgi:hypothetical protein